MTVSSMPRHIVFLTGLMVVVGANPVLVHEPVAVPEGWQLTHDGVDLTARAQVLVGIARQNATQLDQLFWDVSTPTSEHYLNHLSWEAMGQLVRPSEEALGVVIGWLAAHGATSVQVLSHADYVTASLSLREIEIMASGQFVNFVHVSTGQRLSRLRGGVHLPKRVATHVETFTGFHGFPLDVKPLSENASSGASGVTPAVINQAYSISGVQKSGKSNAQAIAQFQGQYVSPSDLSQFCKQYNPTGGDCSIAKFVGQNTPTQPGIESMLDTEYIMGVGQGISTWVYSYPSFDFCSDLLQWASDVASESDHPNVVSLSYGSQKLSFCDATTTSRLSQDVQKLGAMGVTVVIASGDDGSGGITRQGSNGGKLAPSFPASIPYALAVGSTYFQRGTSGPEEATTQFGSGGGFSYDFDMPSYQASAVKGYLAKKPKTGSNTYSTTGRGSPDVALLGQSFEVVSGGRTLSVGGTSASTPTWGAIISLLNEVCLQASGGSKTLGFVNPLFYANAPAFTDITVGSNAVGSNSNSGWKCTEGWDAATGLGTPDFPKLKTVVQKACASADAVVV